MAIIYVARNSYNDKVYVGYTGSPLDKRAYEHKRDSIRTSNRFARAIRKYGFSSFTFSVLEENDDRKHLLQVREPYFIKKFDSTNPDKGYNICRGGRGRTGGDPWNKGVPRTTDEKAKMSAAMTGRKQSKQTVAKRVAKTRGLKRSSATISRISSTWTIISPDSRSMTVTNLSAFCRTNGLTLSCMINVANGKRRHHKGYLCSRLLRGSHSRFKTTTS